MSIRAHIAPRERLRYYADPNRARRQAHRIADVVSRALGELPATERWRRERFYATAAELTSAIEITDRKGRPYLVSTRDPFIGREIFLTGSFEVDRIDAAETILNEHGIAIEHILDIGANIGTTTIEWLARFPDATAHAFEPEPNNARLLRYNLGANDLADRAAVHQIALSDHDGVAELELSPDNPGDHSIHVGDGLGRHAVAVRTARLDTLIDSGTIVAPDSTLVCMDVQGHEGQVIDGAPLMFAHKPPLMCEFWPAALRRAGRYDRLLQQLAEYPVLFEVTRQPQRLTVDQLMNIDEAEIEAVGELELLALAR
jgi:FkbM family methyltransferase